MLKANPTASVVLPTLNEAENVEGVVRAVLAAADESGLGVEVIVVDDGSTDGTRDVVRALEPALPVRLLCRGSENGLAGAVLAGAAEARADVVVVMDADGSHPAAVMPKLAERVLTGAADMAIGSRYVPDGGTPGWPWRRRAASYAGAWLARFLTDVRDPLSGFFAIRRDLILTLGKGAAGFKIGLELLARGGPDLRVEEVPVVFRDREHGQSKLGGAVMGAYVRQLVRLAGVATPGRSALRFAVTGLIAFGVDFAAFQLFLGAGWSLSAAHITSFTAACLSSYLLSSRWSFRGIGSSPQSSVRGYSLLAFVAVLALFLRGGVLAQLHQTWRWPPWAAVIPAILAGAAVIYLGCAGLVFAAPGRDRRTKWRLASLAVVLYLLCLRVAYVGAVELLPQEAYYWNYSEHLDIGYLDHPPMVAWVIRLGTLLLGQTELAVRAGALASSLVAMLFVFALTADLFGRTCAWASLLLMAALPIFCGTGFLMTPDAPLIACWAGALFFLERALVRGRGGAWWGAGACLGLGMLSKYSIVLLTLAALTYMVLDRPSRRWLLSPLPFGAALLAAALFSPVVLWNFKHGWASFTFQSTRRWSQDATFELHYLLGAIVLLVTPMGLGAFAHGLKLGRSSRRFSLCFTLPPLAVFAASSLHSETKLNWTGPIWLAAVPFMALSLIDAAPRRSGVLARMLAASWKPTLAVLLLGYGGFLHFRALGFPGVPYPPGPVGVSWRELARQVGAIQEEVKGLTGSSPLAVGMDRYMISSVLAFYDPSGNGPRQTAGKDLFGRKSLMYGYWFPPAAQAGKSIVLVGMAAKDVEVPSVVACAGRLEPTRQLEVRRGRDVVGRFYTRVIHDYRPPAGLLPAGADTGGQ